MSNVSTLRSRANLRRKLRELEEQTVDATAKPAAADRVAAWPTWKTAAVSSVVSLLVAAIGGWAALSGTRHDASEDRAKESREKRAVIYADYLAAVDAYATTAWQLDYARWERVRMTRTAKSPEGLQTHEDRFDAAAAALTKQRDLVYIYGSDAAWAAVEALDRELRPARELGEVRRWWDASRKAMVTGTPIPNNVLKAPLSQGSISYTVSYDQFRALFCREVSATPRDGCRSVFGEIEP